MRQWKSKLDNHGLLLDADPERLTNLRYADDLLLFANSCEEAAEMFEMLSVELARAGLSINGAKTKILTTDSDVLDRNTPLLLDAGDCMLEVLCGDATHKYLGRLFPGDLRNRGKANLSHRLACGWFKFHTLAPTLLNRKLPIILRLKLFDSVVSPTVTYSLSTTPLTGVQLSMLDATQRKMIRRMVGWVRFDDESWEVTGQRMKARLESALHRFPVRPWSVARAAQRDQIVHKLQSGLAPRVAQMAYQWSPADAALQRGPGRPRQRWYE